MPLDTLWEKQSMLTRPDDPTDPNGIAHATDSSDTGNGAATKAARAAAKLAWAEYVKNYRAGIPLAEFPDNGEIDYFGEGSSVVTNGLILHLDAGNTDSYPGTGTTWSDLSTENNDATLNGPTFSNDSFDFDGTNDFVDAGNITSIGSASTEFSVELWFKPDALESASLIQNGSDFNTNTYYLWQQSSTELVFEVWGGSSFDAISFTSENDYSTGTWYHLVGVWKSGERLKLYKNADSSANTPWLTGTIQNSVVDGDTNTLIGKRGNGFYFDGNIPIVRLYTKALSAEEVQQNFNAEKTRFGL